MNRIILKKIIKGILPFFIPAVLMLLVSCGENVTVTPQASVNLKEDSTVTDVSLDTVLIVDSAKFLIETVRLHRSNDSSTVKLGPFRVYINLSGTLTQWGINGIPAGTYDKISFKIHKHNPGAEPLPDNDSDFVNTIGPVGYSAIIGGTFDGNNFVYRSPKSAHQKVNIDPPLIIPEGGTVYNATLVVQWRKWFLKNGYYMDPRDPANENDIDNNIKDSFNKAFRDNNKDGIPD